MHLSVKRDKGTDDKELNCVQQKDKTAHTVLARKQNKTKQNETITQ